MSECVLQTRRRSQGSREKRRRHVVRKNALASNVSCAATAPIHRPGDVRRNGIVVIREVRWIRRRSSRRKGRRLETREKSGNDISRIVCAGPAAERRGPCFIVPCENRAVLIDTDALVDDER